MSPYHLSTIVARLEARNVSTLDDDARAAVAAIFRAPTDHVDAQVLLIRRAERDGDPWSGHMAFPGGKRDTTDASLFDTAVRETHEEVGLDLLRHARLVTRLPSVPALTRSKRGGMLVTPYIFALDEPEHPPFVLNQEVAETFWVSVGPLARGEVTTTFPYRHEGMMLQLPGFMVQERIVWGLTHRMLSMLFAELS